MSAVLLTDRIAVIAGMEPGLGRDIALAFAREGADTVLAAQDAETLDEVAEEVRALGRRALTSPTDTTDPGQCKHLAEATVGEFGRIDVLVNNTPAPPPVQLLEEATASTWEAAFRANVIGPVEMTKAVVPAMRARRRGSIVFVNALSSRRVQEGLGVRSAAQAALMTVARHFAKELGRDGIRVNSVVPGHPTGPTTDEFFPRPAAGQGGSAEAILDELAAQTALGELPTSAEVADSVVYLASDLARAVTGQGLDVNGGAWFH